MIFNLVLELQKAGVVRASAAGQTVEGGGEVLLRRGDGGGGGNGRGQRERWLEHLSRM